MNNGYVHSLSQTDRDIIISLIPEEARVLDLGCGDCRLLGELAEKKGVTGRGLDIDGNSLIRGMALGIPVVHADLDEGLVDFPDQSYDYVILNQTLQVVKRPLDLIREMLRVGRHGVVGFPNFGHWSLRSGLFFGGRAPKSPTLPFEWYDTPNIRQLTIRDFKQFCREEGIAVETESHLFGQHWRRSPVHGWLANGFSLIGLFVITRAGRG